MQIHRHGERTVAEGQLCLTNQALREIFLQKLKDSIRGAYAAAEKAKREPPDVFSVSQNDGGGGACECDKCQAIAKAEGSEAVVDISRAQRVLEQMPNLVNVDAELAVDDEGQVTLEDAAAERLKGLVETLVEMVSVEPRVSPPPVGGEPPRPQEPGVGRIVNAWDPEGQTSAAGKARASLRQTAEANASVLDGLAQL